MIMTDNSGFRLAVHTVDDMGTTVEIRTLIDSVREHGYIVFPDHTEEYGLGSTMSSCVTWFGPGENFPTWEAALEAIDGCWA